MSTILDEIQRFRSIRYASANSGDLCDEERILAGPEITTTNYVFGDIATNPDSLWFAEKKSWKCKLGFNQWP